MLADQQKPRLPRYAEHTFHIRSVFLSVWLDLLLVGSWVQKWVLRGHKQCCHLGFYFGLIF